MKNLDIGSNSSLVFVFPTCVTKKGEVSRRFYLVAASGMPNPPAASQ